MIKIRLFGENDWPAAWQIIVPVYRAGETYPFSAGISEKEAYMAWIDNPSSIDMAGDEDKNLVGTYYIKLNQSSLGAHVCNCGYIVGDNARGKGVATTMCEHSQLQAISQGFRAMQYNLVATTKKYISPVA